MILEENVKSFLMPDGKPMTFIAKCLDFVVLNILFFVCCIPVITAGAAWTAFYYSLIKSLKRDRGSAVKEYLRGFRDNFKQATILWLCILAVAAGILAGIVAALTYTSGAVQAICLGIGFAVILQLLVVIVYAFPVLSRFQTTWQGILQTIPSVAMKNVLATAVMACLFGIFVALMGMYLLQLPFLILFMPGIMLLILSQMLEPILFGYMSEEEQAAWTEEEGDEDE